MARARQVRFTPLPGDFERLDWLAEDEGRKRSNMAALLVRDGLDRAIPAEAPGSRPGYDPDDDLQDGDVR